MMKRVLYLLLSLSLLVGCGKDKNKDFEPDEPDTPVTPTVVTLELSDADLIFEAEGGQKTFTITSNANWTITNESDWCTTDVASGSGNRTVTVTTQTYKELEDRNMNLTVKAGDKTQVLTVTQKYGNAIVPDKAKFEVAQGGGDLAIRVRSNMTYEVTIPEFCSSWIQPAPETRAEISDTTYRFIIAENEGEDSRTGYIIFSAASVRDTVRIFQAQKDRLVLTQKEYSVFKEDTTITVELRTNVDYDVSIVGDAASWISQVETRASRVDRLAFRIEENSGNTFREGKIVFKDKNSALADTVHVAQFGKVYRGDIVFKAKQELIDFHETGNTGIVGNVTVGGTGLKNLQELGNLLVEIDGDLTLDCKALESLEGLGGLKRITGSFIITKGKMITFDGLDDLESIGGDFKVISESSLFLKSFYGLYRLKSIGGDFELNSSATSTSSSSSLNSLASFEGLDNLESIGGSLKVISSSYHSSSSLNSLESFNGLGKLKSIGGSFEVTASSLKSLESFSGLENLESIGGNFKVSASSYYSNSSLNSLKSFKGLSKLKSIGGDFEVNSSSYSLKSLESFAGLDNLESIGGNFKIITSSSATSSGSSSLESLKSFEGLSKLKSIGGDFEVNAFSYGEFSSSYLRSSSSLRFLESFAGLENLESIGGNFKVISESSAGGGKYEASSSSSSLESLKSFNGLGKLKSIGGDFEVNSSSVAKSALYSTSSSLKSLESFAGLENLESIGGNFKIITSSSATSSGSSSLESLKSFNGLSKLRSIGGDFEVNSKSSSFVYSGHSSVSSSSLKSLEFFAGLESLESIGGNFKITSLYSLKSFDGVDKLKSVQGISITGCYKLYDFCALKGVVGTSGCSFTTKDNKYNPTKDDLLNGNCSSSE